MTGGALQIIGNRPVELVSQFLLDHVGDDRGDATELCMTKRIAGALFGKEGAVGSLRAFRDDNRTAILATFAAPTQLNLSSCSNGNFREDDQHRDIVILD